MEENSESGFCPWQKTCGVSANRTQFPHTHWASSSLFTFDTKSAEVTQTPHGEGSIPEDSPHFQVLITSLGVIYTCGQLTVNSDIAWPNSHAEQVIRIAHRNGDPLLMVPSYIKSTLNKIKLQDSKREEKHKAKRKKEILSVHAISRHSSLKPLMLLPLLKSLNAVFKGFNWQFEVVSLTESLAISRWNSVSILSPPEDWGLKILTF